VLALGATVKTNKRSISADDFFKGLFSRRSTTAKSSPPSVPEFRPKRVTPFNHPASRFA
jgi:carbon-monoxide dehydrogenase medium subunit